MTESVLVIGAPGKVGAPLMDRPLAAGVLVRVAAHQIERARRFADAGAEVVRFDMTDATSFGAFDGVRRTTSSG